MKHGVFWGALGLALALSGGAGAQEKIARGWHIEEFDSGITEIYLVWYDPAETVPRLQLSCTEGWPEVSIVAFIDAPAADPKELALVEGDVRYAMEPISGTVNDVYSTGGSATFTPELIELLSGQFTVQVDGVDIGRYSTKGAADKFGRLFEACPVGGEGR